MTDVEKEVLRLFKGGFRIDALCGRWDLDREEVERIIRDALKRQAMP